MNVNVYNQIFNLFIFTFTGILIGIIFDIFRIIRKSFKTPDFVTYIEDILFWLLTGFILLFSIFTFNNGELRLYIFLALILGLVIYLLTISKYFIKISVKILNFIKNITYVPIKKYIIRPILWIFEKLKCQILKVIKKSNKKINNNDISTNICNKIDE